MLPCGLRPSARQIVDHANSLGLSVERVEALSTQPDTGVGRALGQIFFGSYEPSYVERFVLAAPDGLRWVYIQPYSSDAVMPGEHHFALWGSPPASLWAAGSSWIDRNRQLILRLAILACATIVGLPLGVILFVLLIPRAPRVHGAELAVAINRTPQLQRLRYSGGPFSRDFLIPWALQLHSVGSGSSRLVCVDPGTVRRGLGILQRPRPSFVEVLDLARAAQTILPRIEHPAQQPPRPTGWDDLVWPWLREITPPREPLPSAPAPSLPPKPSVSRARTWAWMGLGAGLGSVFFGLLCVALGISMILHPRQPNAVDSGWCCLISGTVVCILPGLGSALYGGLRLCGRDA